MKVGIYLRLSKEDETSNFVSESITNQKNFLEKYIQDNQWYITETYIDDGWSGLNFDRPAFKKMIEDIENKKIDIVITKDLSRLGRDYIQIGYYLERYFPEKNVRYIAVNDNYDSFNNNGSNDFAPFKAVFNDMYAKDISKKVKTAYKTLQEKGTYLGTDAPYGYNKDNNIKGKLIINKEHSKTINKIYNLYLGGNSVTTIVSILNSENVISPARLINKNSKSTLWNYTSVRRILVNEVYIGNIVQNKTASINYKSEKCIVVPKEQWIRVENMHESIIKKENFEMVQAMLEKKTSNRIYHESVDKKLLVGFLYCDKCKSRITKSHAYIICVKRKIRLCDLHNYKYDEIEEKVLAEVKKICNEYIDEKMLKKISVNKKKLIIKEKTESIQNVENKIKSNTQLKLTLYKDKISGIISEKDFTCLNIEINKEIEALEKSQQQMLIDIQKDVINDTTKQLIDSTIDSVINNVKIDRNILALLVKKIYIGENNKIKIEFTFEKP